jgi:hypothetical protein
MRELLGNAPVLAGRATKLEHARAYVVRLITRAGAVGFEFPAMGSSRVDHYLRQAEECQRRAQSSVNPEHQELYKELARQWQTLAREAENGRPQNVPPY